MTRLEDILARAMRERHALTRNELILLLEQTDSGARRDLYAAAYEVKVRHSGKVVSLRGIIEMGNVCAKNCLYCGIRRDNRALDRFQLDEAAVLEAVQRNLDLHYGSLVLQSGEIESEAHTAFIEHLLRKIAGMSGGLLGITLSLGEQTGEAYARWRAAGAHRYLLRIETSNPRLYARFHPADHSFERRRDCLRLLRQCDYQVGSGVMSGLPGQTCENLADDILFFHEMDVDMIGMGPYLPHHDTPLGNEIALTADYAIDHLRIGLNMIAATRLFLHDVNIAATTALQALADDGREQGILAGANVIMPNVTDIAYRRRYQLYENKPCLDENSEQCRNCLAGRIRAIGETINWDRRGDSPHYAARHKH
jgi:biotin synthase